MLYNKDWDKLEVKVENAVAILRKARAVISNPKHWTCGEYARASNHRVVDVDNPSAVSFCSVGALAFVSGLTVKEAEDSKACQYLEKAALEQGGIFAHTVNDRGHARAMTMFDRAIELALAER
jgi:hypothetical protein